MRLLLWHLFLVGCRSLVNDDAQVVVDFFAEWCGPCKMISPYVASLESQFPDVTFIKVDVDELQDVAAQQNISAMPTFQFFKNGAMLEEFRGASKEKLLACVQKYA